jgi:predicted secreted acid phosphatase
VASSQKCAVVFDIDDTILHRSEHQKDLTFRNDHVYTLYETLLEKNMWVFFVTARPYSPKNMSRTVKQLHDFGYESYNGLFLMPGVAKNTDDISHFKTSIRNNITHNLSFRVILNVGDNWHDLLTVSELKQKNGMPTLKNDSDAFVFKKAGVGSDEEINPPLYCVKLP